MTMAGGTATIQEYFSSMVGDIGIEVQSAKRQFDQSAAMVTQISTYRESVTGVSVEEELSSLLKYQQAYQAAARILNAATDLVDILNAMQQ
jgi:flagellar hook-associated protein 1 FlgK